MKRRLLALLLVLAMLLPMIPMGTLAEEEENVAAYAASASYVIANAEAGYFGDVTVTAEYVLSDADKGRIKELHIVAAAYEPDDLEAMVASKHQVYAPASSGSEELELGYIPEGSQIRVFLLDENNMLLASSLSTRAGDEYPSGQQGDISWKLVEGTLYLTGSGDTEMAPNEDGYSWTGLSSQVNWIVTSGISTISSGAFSGFENLQSVDLGDVKRVDDGAFMGCAQLNFVNGESLQSVGQQAFQNCQSLSFINLTFCTSVDEYAFFGCSNLNYVDLQQVTHLGCSAFENSGISNAELASLQGSVPKRAFAGCKNLKRFYLPEGLSCIDEEAFLASGLDRIFVPAMEAIRPYAFAGCEDLETVQIGEGVKSIGAHAFEGAPIQELYLFGGQEEIGDYAFTDVNAAGVHAANLDSLKQQGKIGVGNDSLFSQTVEEKQEQATEETVPETTEETVPETTEETVPETTEETAPETEEPAAETEEKLTSEEAALDGYYIAPEGAELQEEAALEEMALFEGTDQVSKGYHIASFTGLVPQWDYAFIVSRTPGSLEDEDLLFINNAASDMNGNVQFRYIPKNGESGIVQLYGPEKLTFTADQDYVTLKPGENATVRFTCNDENATVVMTGGNDEPDGALNVYRDEKDGTLWTINISDRHTVTEVESRYLTFEAYTNGQVASTKVRVDLLPEDSHVTGASLGETAVTHNYYSSEATLIPVFLTVDTPAEEENTVSTQSAFDAAENAGLIQGVEFSDNTDEVVKKAFVIDVQDDHTLLLLTRTTAENADGEEIDFSSIAKQLKSSYNVGFGLTIQGQDDPIEVSGLKLNVQKKLPTLKANTVTLNTYAKTSGTVTITGGEVESLVPQENDLVTLVYDDDGTVTASLLKAPAKSSTVNLTAEVKVKGYNQPVTLKVPVKIDAKAPSFKLGQSTWNLCSIGEQSIAIPVQCTAKGIDIEDLTFEDMEVYDAKGNSVEGVYEAGMDGGVLYVYAHQLEDEDGTVYFRNTGKQSLSIHANIVCEDIQTPVVWKLTVNNQEPTLKLDKRSVNMNIHVPVGISLKGTVTGVPEGTGYGVSYTLEGKKFGDASAYLGGPVTKDNPEGAASWVNGIFSLEPKESAIAKLYNEDPDGYETFINDTYTLTVGIWGTNLNKWAKVTLKLFDDGIEFTSVKASGTIDLNNDDSRVTLTPAFKNKLSVSSVVLFSVKGSDGQEYSFDSYMDGDKVVIGRSHGEENLEPGTYTATVQAWMGDVFREAQTTFKVVKNKPTIKVTGKMDSGKGTEATVTTSYKRYVADELWGGYSLAQPKVTLTTAGKNPQPVSEKLYSHWTDWNDGTVTVYPETYNVPELLKAGKYTVTLDYGDGMVLSAPITVTQTATTVKLYKTSVTLHPDFTADGGDGIENTVEIPVGYSGDYLDTTYSTYKFYQANGKTEWANQPYVSVDQFDLNGSIQLSATGTSPTKDTTVKIKVTPDTRIPNKFSWITVKVLGGKSLNKKVTLKAKNALDPSCINAGTEFTVSMSGFDNNKLSGTGTLKRYIGRKWVDVDPGSYYLGVYGGGASLSMYGDNALDPNGKYQVEVRFGEHITGTAAVKVAYGKNRFTVAKAPTLYKKDVEAEMYIHIDQQNMSQQIANVTIKGNTGFTIEPTYNVNYGMNDWTIRYTGNNPAKLKTTTLPLQIFLRGNGTNKPNATVNVKVTVK